MSDRYTLADTLARALMSLRPDLRAMSLDEWICQHTDRLSESELRAANSILAMHPDYCDD